MEVTLKQLRLKPGAAVEQASRGMEVIVTDRGARKARLVPYTAKASRIKANEIDDTIFGLWRDRKDSASVDEQVRSLRRGRSF
jgi:prevent-host-death family protein